MKRFFSFLFLSAVAGIIPVAQAQETRSPDLTIVTDAEQSRTTEKERIQADDRAEKAPTHGNLKGKPPRDSLEMLRQGNQRFVDSKMSSPRRDEKTRSELAASQRPFAIVLSCSDSRVPPEVVFDQGLGDLFVVRTAGHVLDPGPIASIEYALEHLGARLIVVMGHESCGAVKAAITTPLGRSAGSPDLDRLIAKIRPHLTSLRPTSTDKVMRGPVKANTAGVARELMKKSAIVKEKLQHGEISLVTAIYGLSSGQVEFNMWDMDYAGQAELDSTPVIEAVPMPVKRRRGMAAGNH